MVIIINALEKKRPICDQHIYNYLQLFGVVTKFLPSGTSVTLC